MALVAAQLQRQPRAAQLRGPKAIVMLTLQIHTMSPIIQYALIGLLPLTSVAAADATQGNKDTAQILTLSSPLFRPGSGAVGSPPRSQHATAFAVSTSLPAPSLAPTPPATPLLTPATLCIVITAVFSVALLAVIAMMYNRHGDGHRHALGFDGVQPNQSIRSRPAGIQHSITDTASVGT